MDIKEIETFWLASSDDDLDTAITLFKNRKYVQSMFFLHLAVEKMLKASYVNKTSNEAPFGHNLQSLAQKIPGVLFEKEQVELLSKITTFNISARYDDYKRNFYKICNRDFAAEYLRVGQEMIGWLKSQVK